MTTQYYRRLTSMEREVGRHFLSYPQRTDSNYSKHELICCDAYVVFVHAEIESYLENCATRALDLAKKAMDSDRYNRILFSLVGHYRREVQAGESIERKPDKDIWRERGGSAISRHQDTIKANHGIRQENIFKLLSPVGFDVRTIDDVLLLELDQLGEHRGSTAHVSLRERRSAVIDPFVRRKQVTELMGLLQGLDSDISSYLRQHR